MVSILDSHLSIVLNQLPPHCITLKVIYFIFIINYYLKKCLIYIIHIRSLRLINILIFSNKHACDTLNSLLPCSMLFLFSIFQFQLVFNTPPAIFIISQNDKYIRYVIYINRYIYINIYIYLKSASCISISFSFQVPFC